MSLNFTFRFGYGFVHKGFIFEFEMFDMKRERRLLLFKGLISLNPDGKQTRIRVPHVASRKSLLLLY